MITGFSQAYDYYTSSENKNIEKNIDKVKKIYSIIKDKFNFEDLSEGKVTQNSKVYEDVLETISSNYFKSSASPLQ